MKSGSPVYRYECVVCRKRMLTHNTTLRHCDILTQWVAGTDGKGINMKNSTVKIKVSGYIEMSQENLTRLLESYEADPHMGLIYAIPMGYTDASNLEFEIVE